jgi:hypothetical protein
MQNQVLEAALAVMILLLVMSVTAIVRVDVAVAANTEAAAGDEAAASANGRPTALPPAALWTGPGLGGLTASTAAQRKTGLFGRSRYEARHVRGRMPKPRQPGPAGPPWGPATPPPGLPQQSSERWI